MTTDASQELGAHPDLVGLLRGELRQRRGFRGGGPPARVLRVPGRPGRDRRRPRPAVSGRAHAGSGRAGRRSQRGVASAAAVVADLEAAFPDQPARPGRGLRILAVAAAIVVAAGLGVGVGTLVAGRDDAPPSPQRSATLEAVTGDGSGEVSMTEDDGRTSMTIRTHDLPAADAGQFYYAWLLDPATNKMLPLGQVGPSGTASFEVGDTLLAPTRPSTSASRTTTATRSTHRPRCCGRPTPESPRNAHTPQPGGIEP